MVHSLIVRGCSKRYNLLTDNTLTKGGLPMGNVTVPSPESSLMEVQLSDHWLINSLGGGAVRARLCIYELVD